MTSMTGGSWSSSKHAREQKIGPQGKNNISRWSLMSRMTPSSKIPVRNLQHPQSMTSRTGRSWGPSKHARELKSGTQVKNHISERSMTSKMSPSPKTPVRNLQHSPSMTSRTGGYWGTSKPARELQFGTEVKNRISGRSKTSRIIPSSKTGVCPRIGFLTPPHFCPKLFYIVYSMEDKGELSPWNNPSDWSMLCILYLG